MVKDKVKAVRTKGRPKISKASKQAEHAILDDHPLHAAILNDDFGALETLLSASVNLNERDKNGDTPLILAIKENKPNVLAKLLEEGSDINQTSLNKQAPIALASILEHQECLDLLLQHASAPTKTNRNDYVLSDKASTLISSLVELFTKEINIVHKHKSACSLTEDAMSIIEQLLDIKEVSPGAFNQMKIDVTVRLTQALDQAKSGTKYSIKAILKLCRRIIVVMQKHKHCFATELTWSLNKIESIIEERIVAQPDDDPAIINTSTTSAHAQQTLGSWYVRNGYANFSEFIAKNTYEYSQFLKVTKEKIPVKLAAGPSLLEMITLNPTNVTTETLGPLLYESLKRLKEEASELALLDFEDIQALIKECKKLSANHIPMDIQHKLECALRPGAGLHILHFHNNSEYEEGWTSFIKEAFITGAKISLFNYPNHFKLQKEALCCGIAIINKLLESEVHPDKIILQSYGAGALVSNEIRNLFSKQGIEFTSINYQHPNFSLNDAPAVICDLRNLNIYSLDAYIKKTSDRTDSFLEFQPFARYITKSLKKAIYQTDQTCISSVYLKSYPLLQLFNVFLKTNQHCLQNNAQYKNPALPLERIQQPQF